MAGGIIPTELVNCRTCSTDISEAKMRQVYIVAATCRKLFETVCCKLLKADLKQCLNLLWLCSKGFSFHNHMYFTQPTFWFFPLPITVDEHTKEQSWSLETFKSSMS